VQQVGTPLEIYRSPANAFVAEFIGTSNLLRGEVAAEGRVRVQGHDIRPATLPDGATTGTAVTLSVRPEEVHLHPGSAPGENRLQGSVAFVRDVGQSVEVYVDCADTRITSHVQPRDRPDVRQGDAVTVELPPEACTVLLR